MYPAYATRPNLILGFHGCDKSIRDRVAAGHDILHPSNNKHDWLGHGIYFWENNPSRAQSFAEEIRDGKRKTSGSPIKRPAVIGAIIHLGSCLDLLDNHNIPLVQSAYSLLRDSYQNTELPQNKGGDDLLRRELDCAVFETLHESRVKDKKRAFDSIRAVFWEGDELYPDAGFREKNHIQVCVRNPNCIKGFFLPRQIDTKFDEI